MIKIIGPILYIVFSIIGVMIKNASEESKRKQQRIKAEKRISSEDHEVAIVEQFQGPMEATQLFEQTDVPREETEDGEDIELEWAKVNSPVQKVPKFRPNLAQAVIMSEIIRPPRSKRPWPSR